METEGKVVPGYVVEREIGHGGFATVYQAQAEDTGDVVALKVFSLSDVDRRRIRRELDALSRLSGIPNIVPVLGVTSATDGSPVLVMPFLPTTMAAEIESGGVAPDVAVGWLTEIASALDQAALLDVHHRDVKPANVLIDENGHAYLTDFGIAALAEMDTGTTTASAFSPPYAAPERFEGRTDVDPARSDTYSLAATTWAAMVGGAPFGTATTGGVHGLIRRVMANQLDRPESMPSSLYEVLRTGMSLDPAARFGTASALAAAASDALTQPEALDDATVMKLPTTDVKAVAVPPLLTVASTGAATGAGSGDASTLDDDQPLSDDANPELADSPQSNARRVALVAACLLVLLTIAGVVAMVAGRHPDVVTVSRASHDRVTTSSTPGSDMGPPPTVEDTTLDPATTVDPPPGAIDETIPPIG